MQAMRLAIVLFLLAPMGNLSIAQEKSTPRPGEAEKSSSSAYQTKTPRHTPKDNSSQPAPSDNLVKPPPLKSHQGGIAPEDKTQPAVNVGSVPPITFQSQKDWADWGFWVFSLLLVIMGGFQAILLRGALRETRIATGLTRQSLILSQRPHVHVRRIAIDKDIVDSLLSFASATQIPEEIKGTFEIVNTGATTAKVIAIECRAFVWEEIPAAIARTPVNLIRVEPITLRPGVYITRPFSDSIQGLSVFFARDQGRTACVYIVGLIGYEDELGNYRSTSFCRRMEQAYGRLVKTSDEDYEHAD